MQNLHGLYEDNQQHSDSDRNSSGYTVYLREISEIEADIEKQKCDYGSMKCKLAVTHFFQTDIKFQRD